METLYVLIAFLIGGVLGFLLAKLIVDLINIERGFIPKGKATELYLGLKRGAQYEHAQEKKVLHVHQTSSSWLVTKGVMSAPF